ncbi:phage holin family protein [Candidatus Fermentibacterales bacterium]|nr:phage holin family protein [Candidatus Fermentibacterales bacterium]
MVENRAEARRQGCLMKSLVSWAVAGLSMYLASLVLGNRMEFYGGFWTVFWTSLVVGLLNAVLVPITRVITCPIWLLTLGLLRFVVNAIVLLIADWWVESFYIRSFWWALLAAILISIATTMINGLLGRDK